MKTRGTPSSKRNPCPVCGNTHGCKNQDDEWILCLRGMGQQDAPPNYRFVKPLSNGMGGLFVKDDKCDDWNEEQRVTRRQEQELKRRQREIEQAQRRAKLLDIEERDRQYRLVNQDLNLITRHRKVLRERGLTDAEIDLAIELGAIRTWNPGQRILGISPDLAGVDPVTRGLAGVDGIAINALSPDGNITGAQLKPDNQELGKYIWLSSQSKAGSGPQLPNGELPLFVWRHPDALTITEVWLCEGALKSLIVALKLWFEGKTDIAIIGTASAARYGEKTLKDYLECLGAKSVCLMPDSGSAVNPHITQANRETIHHLKKWNYSVSIGDWGQLFEKNQLDIDELLVAGRWGEVQTISPSEFLQLHQPGGSDRHPLELHRDIIEQVKQRADIVHTVGQYVELTKRGKDFVGLCPFHDEKTPSFSVSPSKQLYQCYGCDASGNAIKFLMELGSRSFTNAVLELAQRYQVEARWADGSPASADSWRDHQFTGSQWGEPDPAAYAEYVDQGVEFERLSEVAAAFEKQQRDRQRFNEWQWKHGIPNWFREKLRQFRKTFTGFGKPPETKESKSRSRAEPLPKIIRYVPGDKLPTPEQYKAMGCPIIRFTQGLRLQLIAELVALGWHYILDTSGTGASKSYDAGLAEPNSFGVDRLWYFSEDHRNPTTATVEANYTDLPVRNDGMKVDSSRKTALNNPHVRWPKQGETATTVGNCFRTKEFHTLEALGYEQEAGAEAQLNIICRTCHMRELCGNSEKAGPGHSFRNDRREALASSDRIRASLNSSLAPRDLEAKVKASSEGEEVVSNRNAAFYDEAMRQLKPINTVEAQLSDFDRTWAEIEAKLPAVHSLLKPVRLTLRPILAGEIKPTQETYHGYNDATIRDKLGKVPENLADIIRRLTAIKPNLEEILKNPDSFNLDGVDKKDRKNFTKEQSKRLRSMVRQNSYQEMAQDLRSLAPNWLVPFLEVWGGLQPGGLRIKNGVLSVTTRDTRHAEIAEAMQFNVYLDATANRDYLALYLNISPDSAVQIQQETGSFENLTINQIDGLGLAGHNRSDSLKGKIVALKQEFKQHHPDIAFLDHKEHANAEEGDGWYFNHNRGSNEYKTRSAIAAFGIPYQDIGSLQAVYMTLTGSGNVDRDAPGFSAFVQWQTQSEIAQTVGRLRANLRPDEPTAYYSCADFDLGFLEAYYPGATIKKVSAFDITPQAGTRTEQRDWKVFSAARQVLTEAGVTLEKMTQAMLAASAGVSQGRIAQIAAEYGGWNEYKKLLGTVLGSLNRVTNNSPPLDEEQQLIADTYLKAAAESDPPPEAVEAMFHTAQVYGWRVFEAINAATSPETRGRLLAALVSGLPPALRDDFMALAAEFQIQ